LHPEEVKIEHQGSIWKGVTFLNENRVIKARTRRSKKAFI
jgi:hypothetical protein